MIFLKGIPVGQEDIQSEADCQCPCRCPCSSLGCEDCCHNACDHLVSVALAVIHTNSRTYKCLEHQSNGRSYSEDRAKKLTTGMISTLKNVASLKEAIPPRRDFIAFFPSL